MKQFLKILSLLLVLSLPVSSFAEDKVVIINTGSGAPNMSAPYEQTLVVSKSGPEFTTIQGAIDSITDATSDKRYAILVKPGDYSENVTLKDYVDLVGRGRTNTRITGTSGTVLTFPANKATVSDMGIYVDYGTLTADSTAVASAGADSALLRCSIEVTKSGGDFTMKTISVTGGEFRMIDCYHYHSITGATTGSALIQSALYQSGAVTLFLLHNNELVMTSNDTNDTLAGFETLTGSVGSYLIQDNIFTITGVGAGASAGALYLHGTATGATLARNTFTVAAPTTAWGFYIDSEAGGATVYSDHNEIEITSAGNAYEAQVAAGDIWNSTFDRITAADGKTGAGTVNLVSSTAVGSLSLTDCKMASSVVTLTTAQVNALRATPITLVAAQGANTIIEFVSAVLMYDYATAAFTVGADEDFVIEYADGTDVSGSIETTGFLDQVDDEVRYVPSAVAVNTDLEPCINQALRIFNTGSGETTGGGGEVDVRLVYRVHKTGF